MPIYKDYFKDKEVSQKKMKFSHKKDEDYRPLTKEKKVQERKNKYI